MTRQRISTNRVRALAEELSERDLRILETVDKLHYARADQLERLHFCELSDGSRSRRRRDVLGRLTRHQLLQTLDRRIGGVRAGSSGFVYALGPAGQRLGQLGSGDLVRTRRAYEPSLLFLSHTLAGAEVFTMAHETRLELLQIETEPACWRRVLGGSSTDLLKSDLYIECADGDVIHDWFIEVDLGTERGPALKRKAERYLEAYRHGLSGVDDVSFPRVLWLVPDESRQRFLETAFSTINLPSGLFEVAVMPGDPPALARLLLQGTGETNS